MPSRASKGSSERDSLLDKNDTYDYHEKAPCPLPSGERWRILFAVWFGVLLQVGVV